MTRMTFMLAAPLTLSACATTPADGEPPARPPAGECDASGVQDHVGHTASAQAGATLLRLTGARTLRWVPPRTAVTMDFRQDRLTVSYDDDMVIERISCG
ncbi:MAG: I78 family peptidase inhibitor [Alteraurantiacibacter sp.]